MRQDQRGTLKQVLAAKRRTKLAALVTKGEAYQLAEDESRLFQLELCATCPLNWTDLVLR